MVVAGRLPPWTHTPAPLKTTVLTRQQGGLLGGWRGPWFSILVAGTGSKMTSKKVEPEAELGRVG